MPRRLFIVDVDGSEAEAKPTRVLQTGSLSEEFGRNLDTIEKARQWLTHPQNWHVSKMFIVKWNGLLPTLNKEHALRLIDEPHDTGLPQVVVVHQRDLKNGKKTEAEEPVAE